MHQFPLEGGEAGWVLCRGCRSVLPLLLLLPSPACPRSCSSYLLPALLHLSPPLTQSSYSLCRIKHTRIISDGCLSNLLLKIPSRFLYFFCSMV